MRYTELTVKDKQDFLDMFNKQGSKADNVKNLSSKFGIKKSTIYTFHSKIMDEFYPQGVDVADLEYNNDGDLVIKNSVIDDMELVKALNKIEKLESSLIKSRDENTLLRKTRRENTRDDSLKERISKLFEMHIGSLNINKHVQEKRVNDIERTDNGLCVLFSDEHFGELVSEEVTPYNNYNYDIIEKRLLAVVDDILSYHKQSDTLNVFQLLDVLKGVIHNGKFTSEGGLTTSMIKVVDIYSNIYTRLASQYDNIKVVVTNSNHDRITENPTSKDKWDSYGIMLMKFIDKILQAKGINNVEFSYTKHDYQLVKINNTNVIAFHGDSLRNYKPYNENEISKLQDICIGMYRELFTHAVSGHIHKHYSCDNMYGGKCISNSSLVGNSEYGTSNGFRSITPSQTIFFIEEDGKIKDVSTVDLSKII